jgi:hypothetical protein
MSWSDIYFSPNSMSCSDIYLSSNVLFNWGLRKLFGLKCADRWKWCITTKREGCVEASPIFSGCIMWQVDTCKLCLASFPDSN